ncbi:MULTISPECIES: hypothetical protein [Carnobacterium]|uniref:Uncharacterized protein n=1 Tax=Carnobacterium antarcticum TaxID=2126436 RepID=A0ABW4NJP4_9LACT|nr:MULTISPECIES: hypothetical protein [unclassified Carnobacterium]QQP70390.1 hypothetical protein JHE06_00590 [Carnobacterium sp. CS13]
MTVTIKRKTGWLGMGSKISINVNGEKAVKIAHSQEIDLDIQNNNAYLKVTQFGAKSNEVKVIDGDTVEITSAKWSYISYYLFYVFLFIINFILHLTTMSFSTYVILLIFGFLLFLGSFVFVNNYCLEILDNKTRNETI